MPVFENRRGACTCRDERIGERRAGVTFDINVRAWFLHVLCTAVRMMTTSSLYTQIFCSIISGLY